MDCADTTRHPIIIGMRLEKWISREGAQRLVEARQQAPFRQISDLRRRAQLDKRDMEALADADALASLAGHRHQSQWQIMALEEARPLLQDEQFQSARQFDDGVALPAPAVAEELLSDYRATWLTLRAQQMSLLSDRASFNRCVRLADLGSIINKRFVRNAVVITCCQRPGTASGVHFLTLEDEPGSSNFVVW